MESESQQQPRNQRRKRKDPESRDFMCKCGKGYLSYAAAYTHVKNKHGKGQEHLITKPQRDEIKRGRPKERKAFKVSHQIEQLSIVEEAILFIHEALRKGDENKKCKLMLECNEEQRPDELAQSYDALRDKLGDPGVEVFFKGEELGGRGHLLAKFVQHINKHFLPQTAIKNIWLMNYLGATCTNLPEEGQDLQVDYQKVASLPEEPEILKLWQQHPQVPKIITSCFEKWMEVYSRIMQGHTDD